LTVKVELLMVKSKVEVVKAIQEVVRARYCQEWVRLGGVPPTLEDRIS
jgi:hypothetical protein